MPSRFNLGVLHRSFLPWGLIARLFELRSIGPLPNSRHRPQAPNYCLFTLALHVASTRCTLSSLAFYRTAIPLGTSDLLLVIPHYISRSTKALLSLQDSPVKTTTRNGTSTFTGPGRITARVLEPHHRSIMSPIDRAMGIIYNQLNAVPGHFWRNNSTPRPLSGLGPG
jgi:hypothetical protein